MKSSARTISGGAKPVAPAAGSGGELRLVLVGFAILLAAALFAFAGFGPGSGAVSGIVLFFIFVCLGLSALAAVVINRWFDRHARSGKDNSWF